MIATLELDKGVAFDRNFRILQYGIHKYAGTAASPEWYVCRRSGDANKQSVSCSGKEPLGMMT
jgi:hypothetical protein